MNSGLKKGVNMAKKITIPIKKSSAEISMRDVRWHLHGFPKTGKTTLASLMGDKVLFIQTEVGTKGMAVYGSPVETWDDIEEVVTLLEEDQQDFETVCIDTIERAYLFDCLAVAEEAGVSDISEIGFGGGWRRANQNLYNMLERLYRLFGVVLISHTRTIEQKFGVKQVNKMVPDLSDSPRSVVTGWVDGILYLEVYEDEEVDEPVTRRRLICQPSPYIEAGGRVPFQYFPEEIDLGSTPAEGFANLEVAFDEAAQETIRQHKLSVKGGKTRTRRK